MSELRTIARHAGTVLVGQLAVMAFGVADTVIAGRYSPHALAVLSLASSIYISIYVALNGMLQALLPVWAELHGGNRHAEIGRSVRQALYISAGAAALGITGLWFPDPWLSWTQVPTELWPDVRAYLRVLALALVPSLLFRMYSTLNQSLGYPRLVTWLQAGALLVKIPLSVLLTFGAGDVAGMGVVGLAAFFSGSHFSNRSAAFFTASKPKALEDVLAFRSLINSRPFLPGREMSMTTSLGLLSMTPVSPLSASEASPTSSRSGSLLMSWPRPWRMIGWSSTMKMRCFLLMGCGYVRTMNVKGDEKAVRMQCWPPVFSTSVNTQYRKRKRLCARRELKCGCRGR